MTGWKGTPGPWKLDPNARHPWRVTCPTTMGDADEVRGTVCEVSYKPNAESIAAVPQLVEALDECLALIDDMSRFVGQMSLRDYQRFNEAPIKGRAALRAAGVTP